MRKMLKDYCVTCKEELIQGINVKQNFHKPLCNKCREIIYNYFTEKEMIDRIRKARFVREKEQEEN